MHGMIPGLMTETPSGIADAGACFLGTQSYPRPDTVWSRKAQGKGRGHPSLRSEPQRQPPNRCQKAPVAPRATGPVAGAAAGAGEGRLRQQEAKAPRPPALVNHPGQQRLREAKAPRPLGPNSKEERPQQPGAKARRCPDQASSRGRQRLREAKAPRPKDSDK